MAMELRALFLLPLCFPGLQGQTPEAQRRREGGTLYFECPYTAQTDKWQTKYWCLQPPQGGCQPVVSTYYGDTVQSQDRRITIKDDSPRKTVSITMTDLKTEDSGTYSCAIYKNNYIPLKIMSLIVFKEVLRWELDTVSVQCPYRSGVAWCRRGQSGCTVLVERQTPSQQSAIKSWQDRVSVKYKQGTLTVTMEKLQTRDSGVYWCALDSGRTQITEVVLSVFKRTQKHTVEESGNVTVQCHYKIADYSAVSKAWCKKEEGETCDVLATTSSEPPAGPSKAREGVRIQDDVQQGIVTITMEQLQVQDSGVYWCALQEHSGLSRIEEVMLNVSKAFPPGDFPDTESRREEILLGDSPDSSGSTFIVVSVVLLILLLLALLTATALGVRHYKLLERTGVISNNDTKDPSRDMPNFTNWGRDQKKGNREAEDTSDRAEGTAQPGSTGRRESSQGDSKGPAYINLDAQSQPSPEDPLYCNVEPSQARRSPQHVEYAVIAFNKSPRSGRE